MEKGVVTYVSLSVYGCGEIMDVSACWVNQANGNCIEPISGDTSQDWMNVWGRCYNYLKRGDPKGIIYVSINPQTSKKSQQKLQKILLHYKGVTLLPWSNLAEDVSVFGNIGRWYKF